MVEMTPAERERRDRYNADRRERRARARDWNREMDALTPAERAAWEVLPYSAHSGPWDAREVVAKVRPLIAGEVALELGREVLRDGLVPFLDRLVGPENATRLLAPIATETLSAAADRFVAQHPWNGTRYRPEHVAADLRQYAAELEQEARDG